MGGRAVKGKDKKNQGGLEVVFLRKHEYRGEGWSAVRGYPLL